jgi:hypothetical protein
MTIPATYMSPEGYAAVQAAADRMKRELQEARTRRQTPPTFEVHFLDEQRHARALQEIAMRNDQLRGIPSCFAEL